MPVDRFLTAADRCDWRGCGAAAYARVYYEAAPEPVFIQACGHHFSTAPASMLERSMYHLDETEWINA